MLFCIVKPDWKLIEAVSTTLPHRKVVFLYQSAVESDIWKQCCQQNNVEHKTIECRMWRI